MGSFVSLDEKEIYFEEIVNRYVQIPINLKDYIFCPLFPMYDNTLIIMWVLCIEYCRVNSVAVGYWYLQVPNYRENLFTVFNYNSLNPKYTYTRNHPDF